MSQSKETIFVSPKKSKNKYHTDPDCPALEQVESQEVNQQRFANYDLCRYCEVGRTEAVKRENPNTSFECPICGEEVGKIPEHIKNEHA
jgi:transcription elongation factor Elf1